MLRIGSTAVRVFLGIAAALGMATGVIAAHSPADTQSGAQSAWRNSIVHLPVPHQGCFTAAYPANIWSEVACVAAPDAPYIPGHNLRGWFAGVGAGAGIDYTAVSAGLTSAAVGSFPTVTGVTTETGAHKKLNSYSIQLNSQYFASPTCSGAAIPAKCQGWEQFIYSNTGKAFLEYWLINYSAICPVGWKPLGPDCYRTGAAVQVPPQAIAQLAFLGLSGQAVAGGIDTLTFTTATNAYSTTGQDSVVGLAGFWKGTEYNIVGDGSGANAVFNTGSNVTVKIALTDGSTVAPVCAGDTGSTSETNNLKVGACKATSGTPPSVSFTESR